jgi:hypothetical protein
MPNADVCPGAFMHAASMIEHGGGMLRAPRGTMSLLPIKPVNVVLPLTGHPSFAAMRWRKAIMYRSEKRTA